MAEYKIFVKCKDKVFDAEAEKIKKDIFAMGVKKKLSVKIAQIYKISGSISFRKIKKICTALLVDPLIQVININFESQNKCLAVEVYYKNGVTDTVAETVKIGIKDMGIGNELFVKTGKKYFFESIPRLSKKELKLIAKKILANTVIHNYRITNGN
ncbi:MAG: phosphoribosylformylglycinamidine synthase subunit PurS [Elusimicrobiota bacterium]